MKMVTYYNRKDLVSFGNYLAEQIRKANAAIYAGCSKDGLPFKVQQPDGTFKVSHADIENWKETIKKE